MGVAKKRPGLRKVENSKGKNPLRVVKKTQSPGKIFFNSSDKAVNDMTSVEKMELIEKGISKGDLVNFKEVIDLDYEELSKILLVTRATLINKKDKEKFNSSVSEKILSLADIYSYGYEVFEDQERFNEWVFKTNTALGGKRPLDFLNNSFGREEVKNLIGRIEYGVFS